MKDAFVQSPHRRWNPLKREWVLVSPHRTLRPWQGQTETVAVPTIAQYDTACYLCPGNVRAEGHHTPSYESTFVFENDYAALKPDVPEVSLDVDDAGLLRAQTEGGVCRVICFSPRHDLTLATMEKPAIFENRGAMMGASNPHPHGQIWATEHLPNEAAVELASQQAYFAEHNTSLLADYLALELREQERIVAENDGWVALVPFWAVWPFELLLLPKFAATTMHGLDTKSRQALADILSTVCSSYNRVFDTPFPYSMGFHAAPCDDAPHPEWTLHAHFFPPLLRSATVRKFMVGFELLGSPQRDITPESAAATLRAAISGGTQ